jgi:tripartite ATP-independent transporter DctP family solute receptor
MSENCFQGYKVGSAEQNACRARNEDRATQERRYGEEKAAREKIAEEQRWKQLKEDVTELLNRTGNEQQPQKPEQPQRPRISIALAQNSHQGVAIDTFAKEVDKRTGGRYEIQTFYSGSLGGERELIEAVQRGTQQLAFISSPFFLVPKIVPETKILDIPFLFRDKAHARAVLDGPIGQDLLTKFEPKGFKALGWGENGVRHMTNSKRPIITPDDAKGLKMRTMENPVHVAAYTGLGIVTTPMAFSEVFTALQQGTLDGQENPLSVIVAAKFEQVQKYLSLTGHIYSPCIFLMNKDAFDKLSAADKTSFLEAAKVAIKANRERVDADDAKGVAELRSKGMAVVENVDKAKFVEQLKPVYAEFDKQFGKANLDKIRNYK